MAATDKRIEDYGFIGNMRTSALIDRDASIEWLCMPRFDSDACCASLLGTRDNGYWQIVPTGEVTARSRRYRGETLVLETEFETADGRVAVIDFMPVCQDGETTIDLMRVVEGRSGSVEMLCDTLFRFDYGDVTPLVHHGEQGMSAISGPNALRLWAPFALKDGDGHSRATFTVSEGERVPFVLTWYESHKDEPEVGDAFQAMDEVEQWWRDWASRCDVDDEFREPVVRSLITLKALTDAQTGGMVGAASCSLPERIHGEANWDYRYTWLRDATFTLYALLASGYKEEAYAWRQWLLRVAAGEPGKLQPIYGIAGERRLPEQKLSWLSGFNGCTPVRIGNGAYRQVQLDIHGEVMDGLHVGRIHDLDPDEDLWQVQCQLVEYLEDHWQDTGASLWELRGPERHYTHSRVMAWVAFDRAIKGVEDYGLEGDVARWKALRQQIHDDICEHGFNRERNTFVQYYGGEALDASLLLIPLVGFLPADDPRMVGTIEAIQQDLMKDGFVYRFVTDKKEEDLTRGEGAFLVCGFWLVDNLLLLGRRDEARELFDRLSGVRNDLGLLSEEYHPDAQCLLGNFPQAFSHVGLINSAHNLARDRSDDGESRERPARSRPSS
ncbi:glycoside hydrolase family 15 protein [Kushneria phosphatilytica]|uniref:Glycoside hydrolase family 15 protein n=1 Tax=Kushneria phosphatilytica TaxID=657387 RepID=A0A1S1NNB2_9GAMM|nr:glycoside hydrolase family 15 protein [Kushneria phosphatilytica]OHV08762.1 glucoamylase [Kushneria phosphatilytica]QEL12481.1 glycoside hydrolase family 15 protein [Kushneria phosphatilytica]